MSEKRTPLPWLSRTARLARGAGAALGAFAMLWAVVPLPACEHVLCGLDCSPVKACMVRDASDCPSDRGCHKEPACVCAEEGCWLVDCVANTSAATCAQTIGCVWGERCMDNAVDCKAIDDEDTCERMLPCTVHYNC